ncbi:hypothetical protein [Mycoavidus sp. SF9855]|uniref:hypothetical protein n=1 Tax=Mycoavidus sp. SF9855 TaxID=2968475 RepID=UPI00211CF728|nr:hypothetical protein [Mycoavidus sp. SF9855]UUM20932.1 hypothetical protein NQD60_05470 [Mycoavidus sp. SF9855]
MSPSTNAACSSSTSTPIYISTVGPYTGKGKQRADPAYEQKITDERGLCIVDDSRSALTNPSAPDYAISTHFAFTENQSTHKILSTCERIISTTNAHYTKIADPKGGLNKFKEICEKERETIAKLEVKDPIGPVTHIGLETAKETHSAFLQERVNEALRIVDSICQIIQTLVAHPKESVSAQDISSLEPLIENIVVEIVKLQKSLPSPAKAFLGVLFVAGLVAPFMGLIWYILGTLGLFSMTAVLPQALATSAWVVGVIFGIIIKWPDYKNACAERASSSTRQLIQCHETIRSAHKEFKKKMDSVKLDKLGQGVDNTLRATSIAFAKVNEVSEKLDRVLASRSESASPDAELAAENARLREENKQLREYNMQLMASAMKNINKNA